MKLRWNIVFSHMMALGILLLFTARVAEAQRPDSSRLERMVERYRTGLSLSDDQTVKVREILSATIVQREKDRSEHQGDRQAMMELGRERMEKADKEIEKLLTEEQVKKYQKFKEERRRPMRGRRGMRGDGW